MRRGAGRGPSLARWRRAIIFADRVLSKRCGQENFRVAPFPSKSRRPLSAWRRAIRPRRIASAGDDGMPGPSLSRFYSAYAPGWPHAGADFSSASSEFKVLGAFFCNFATSQLCHSSGSSAGVAHGQPRARVPHLVGSRLPSPYHFPARIQSFQAVAAPFPGNSFLPSASPAAIPATETSRSKRSKIGSAVSAGTAARTNIELLRHSGKKFVERLGSYATLPNPKSFPQVFEGNLFFEGNPWLLLCYSNILQAFPKPAPSFSNPCPQTGLEPARPGSEGA